MKMKKGNEMTIGTHKIRAQFRKSTDVTCNTYKNKCLCVGVRWQGKVVCAHHPITQIAHPKDTAVDTDVTEVLWQSKIK